MLSLFIGLMLFAIYLFLSAIHFYWGLGGKRGIDAVIPTNDNNDKIMSPGRFECFVVAIGLLAFGFFILIKIQIVSVVLPSFILKFGLLTVSSLFIFRSIGEFKYVGFFKRVRNTKFGKMDTKYYSPLCLFMGIFGIILDLLK